MDFNKATVIRLINHVTQNKMINSEISLESLRITWNQTAKNSVSLIPITKNFLKC